MANDTKKPETKKPKKAPSPSARKAPLSHKEVFGSLAGQHTPAIAQALADYHKLVTGG